uniref:(northern house mosquito) hypothetical protein n=1 Tax=Culex pipiens TaxID=7175 RepID=A0A8D8BXT4_CULPI
MKCVVPSCPYDEESTTLQFFSVPPSCSSSFKKWQAHFFLSGLRYEKICQLHFVDSDFRKSAKMLNRNAIPSQNLPDGGTFSGSVLIVQPNFQAEVENDFAAAVKVEDPLDID